MKKRLTYFTFLALALTLVAMMFILSPTSSSGQQQDERDDCQKECTNRYQACRRATNANQSQCQDSF